MDFKNEALLVLENVADRTGSLFRHPTLRLGVTGLSRAGKTVFITSLIHNLVDDGRLPAFKAFSGGRVARAYLEPQPDNLVPRFQYEDHLDALTFAREWPASTRSISELRLTLEFESEHFIARNFTSNKLSIDIVDYPGEWLLDLSLMEMSYADWCRDVFEQSALPTRAPLAKHWLSQIEGLDPQSPADEGRAQHMHSAFVDYLRACRADATALSALPPGRFLMPGDMEGAPALTFVPLRVDTSDKATRGSWHSLMAQRFDAYKAEVVYPFFREHFARLDRQIVLVDTLQALNAGPYAVADLRKALDGILSAFRAGQGSFLSGLLGRKIDRILFAATKADHVHHSDHDQLSDILSVLVEDAIAKSGMNGASFKTVALSAVRATREAEVKQEGQRLPVLAGLPAKGERIGDEVFDGETEGAIFPGDLPISPRALLKPAETETNWEQGSLNFVRFRPPDRGKTAEGLDKPLPHIRLDEVLEFLLGDRLA